MVGSVCLSATPTSSPSWSAGGASYQTGAPRRSTAQRRKRAQSRICGLRPCPPGGQWSKCCRAKARISSDPSRGVGRVLRVASTLFNLVSRSRRMVGRRSLRTSRCSATKAGQFIGPAAGAAASNSAAAARPMHRSSILSGRAATEPITAETQSRCQAIGSVTVVCIPAMSRRVWRSARAGGHAPAKAVLVFRASRSVPTQAG
jgi:hypothetical protein